jgi:hypothetical protein
MSIYILKLSLRIFEYFFLKKNCKYMINSLLACEWPVKADPIVQKKKNSMHET